MGHPPNVPCSLDHVHRPDGARCSTPVPPEFVDLARTRWHDVAGTFYRTNSTAASGFQVEFRRQDGRWETDGSYATEAHFLRDVRDSWRELDPDEAARMAGGDR